MTAERAIAEAASLLGPGDPEPYRIVNPEGKGSGVIVCDHASNAVPRGLDRLGLPPEALARHIGYDIGAAGVAERLADALDLPAVISGFSRLVIDMNRLLDDFTSIREISDGVVVPANRNLPAEERRQRAELLFWPYHDAVSAAIADKRRAQAAPAIVSVHSCTDTMRGHKRPWHIGVLYNRDNRMAKAVMAELRNRNPDLTIGDNKPYSGLDPYGYTIETHALPAGLPNVLFEVRQDLIRDAAGQERFAAILARALEPVLADDAQLTLAQS